MTIPTVNETAATMVALATAAHHEDGEAYNALISGLDKAELRLVVSALIGSWLSSLNKLGEVFDHPDMASWFLQELGGDAARGEVGQP